MIPLKKTFIENFISALSLMGIEDYQTEKFVIIPTTEQEKMTSRDEIYKMWVTPCFTGIRRSFDSVIEVLVKEAKKVAPIRIKISKEPGQPIFLETSQRYRKLRDLTLRKRDNLIFPFEMLEESDLEFSEEIERSEAIRILFFKRTHSSDLKEIIGDKISFEEVLHCFENYFKQYTHYPPSYDKFQEGDESFSSLVMSKDVESDEYSLYHNPIIQKEIHSKLNLKDALDIYISKELKHSIYGVEIVD